MQHTCEKMRKQRSFYVREFEKGKVEKDKLNLNQVNKGRMIWHLPEEDVKYVREMRVVQIKFKADESS